MPNDRPHIPNDNTSNKQVVVIALFLFVLFALIIIQFFKIQIIEGERWSREAQAQHQRVVTEPFRRGTFYSNTSIKLGHPDTKQPIVIDVQKFHLCIDPSLIPEHLKDTVATTLMHYCGTPLCDRTSFRSEFERKSRCRKVSRWLDAETRQTILDWWNGFARREKIARNAIFFVPDYQRSYPFGKLLGQVLHTIRDDKDEVTKEGLPTGGLELQFNHLLKGKQGKRLFIHSPRNPLEVGTLIEAPQNGADIYLTINHYLQAIAEEEIAKGVMKVGAKGGWAVMMDPFTGEVLALAQYPFFDPSKYREYFNDPALTEHTKVKAVTDANEIGSTMKPLTLLVCFRANEELKKRGEPPIFSITEKVAISDGTFPGRKKKLTDVSPCRFVNMYLSIQKSSNVYVARMVDRVIKALGNTWYKEELEKTFGFGTKTGIELPGEAQGVVPQPGKKHPNGRLEWSVPTPYSLAMGHNIQGTSFQLLRTYALLANGGIFVEPTLVRKISRMEMDGKETVLLDNTLPERLERFPRMLDKEMVAEVVKAMKFTTKPHGSGSTADIWGYTEAGKSSSVEKIVNGVYSKTRNISGFVGFAPVEHPRFVLLVMIDEPEPVFIPGIGKMSRGGKCSAPVFREIGQRTLEYLGVTPDDPYGYPVGDPRYDPEKADWAKETREMRQLYKEWNH